MFNIYSLAEAMVQIKASGGQQDFTRLLTHTAHGLTLVLRRDPWFLVVSRVTLHYVLAQSEEAYVLFY